MNDAHKGGCLCGAVSFQVQGPLRDVVACHCSQCRRQSGHFFAATSVAEANLAVDGADNISWYRSSDAASRGFCRVCGSILFWKPEQGDHLGILAGAFDQPSGLRLTRHIFCADKGDYYDIADGLPQFARSDATTSDG